MNLNSAYTTFKSLRPEYWWKNLLILLPAFFYNQLSVVNLESVLIGFSCFSFITSAGYLFNSYFDRELDIHHPTKAHRQNWPFTQSFKKTSYLAGGLIFIALLLSISLLPYKATLGLVFYLISAWAYNFEPLRLKDVLYLDAFAESFNFPLRWLTGAWIIESQTSLAVFMSLWLLGAAGMLIKRAQDLRCFPSALAAGKYRKTLARYSYKNIYTMAAIFFFAGISIVLCCVV